MNVHQNNEIWRVDRCDFKNNTVTQMLSRNLLEKLFTIIFKSGLTLLHTEEEGVHAMI
jgi:hypothetical protein